MRTGILFGGRSREREISFAGGRTVFDLLDKTIFEPVPVFIDGNGNFILLNWQYLYKGSIRDFYPPSEYTPESVFQIYIESLGELTNEELEIIINKTGKQISPDKLKDYIDFAFLTLHGPYGEDGTVQGILDYYDIPYTGSGILSSAIGINKAVQKQLMQNNKFNAAKSIIIKRDEWLLAENKDDFFNEAKKIIKYPLVIKASSQGSSIGVKILNNEDKEEFIKAVYRSFFIEKIELTHWKQLDDEQKKLYIRKLVEIQEGIGFPVKVAGKILYHPDELFKYLENNAGTDAVYAESLQVEPQVLIEEFILGKEFSCIVIQDDEGKAVALPPTEIRKSGRLFDYRAKYLPGISNKITPIELPDEQINEIRKNCEELFNYLSFNVYARIDGMITEEGKIFLNDPNTTSGMLPSSFFFHQAAEIGLSPSQFLTYIIRTSLAERKRNSFTINKTEALLNRLDELINKSHNIETGKPRVAVILGGYSSERHISVESGRNVFEKLSSSGKYDAIPVFLTGSAENIELYSLPLNLLLKDNADDIRHKVNNFRISPVIDQIINEAKGITEKYASKDYEFYPQKISLEQLKNMVEFVFIALHGRPGEDGTLQQMLEMHGLPYNGSGYNSSQITIDKYRTNQILRDNGLLVPENFLVLKNEWFENENNILENINVNIGYPLIAKPSDDGCSSAVKKIKNEDELRTFAQLIFRKEIHFTDDLARKLNLKPNEEFPLKDYFVVEELISSKGAKRFIEITGGMITRRKPDGGLEFEVFEPSEALAGEGILSLEEKFLAGEGQNITPARFVTDAATNRQISDKVKSELRKAAEVTNVEGYCRIDAFVRIFDNNEVEVVFIEINSLPGLTPATCIFHQAAINNYKPYEFLDAIINYGKQKTLQH